MTQRDGLYLVAAGKQVRVTQAMVENWLAVRPGQPTTLDGYIAEDVMVAVSREVTRLRRVAQQEARP